MKSNPKAKSKNKAQKRALTDIGPATLMVHGRFRTPKWDYSNHLVPPSPASSAYRLESVERGAAGFLEFANPEVDRDTHQPIYIYDRLDEPTRGMLEESIAELEGGDCAVAFATGMAAVSAALGVLVRAGDHVVAHGCLYGCSYSLLANWYPRIGVGVTFTNVMDLEKLKKAIKPETRAIYFETPINPTIEVIDIGAIRALVDAINAKRRPEKQIRIVVDNTFNTPLCQRPLTLGAHVVLHSLTKGLSGFGTDMGGIVIAPRELETELLLYRKDFGAPLAPKAAWSVLVYGLPSLEVRFRKQMASALAIAQFLESHPRVARVSYPGLPSHPQHELAKRQMRDYDGNFTPGVLIYFELKGAKEAAKAAGARLMNYTAKKSHAITLAVSLGQVRTLIEHPSSMTHAAVPVSEQVKQGIAPGGVRISIGLEEPSDIERDLSEALDRAR